MPPGICGTRPDLRSGSVAVAVRAITRTSSSVEPDDGRGVAAFEWVRTQRNGAGMTAIRHGITHRAVWVRAGPQTEDNGTGRVPSATDS
jgi:spore germination cell wall hydrolase CwlJ-like protein